MKHNLLTIKSQDSPIRFVAINSIRLFWLCMLYLLVTNFQFAEKVWEDGNSLDFIILFIGTAICLLSVISLFFLHNWPYLAVNIAFLHLFIQHPDGYHLSAHAPAVTTLVSLLLLLFSLYLNGPIFKKRPIHIDDMLRIYLRIKYLDKFCNTLLQVICTTIIGVIFIFGLYSLSLNILFFDMLGERAHFVHTYAHGVWIVISVSIILFGMAKLKLWAYIAYLSYLFIDDFLLYVISPEPMSWITVLSITHIITLIIVIPLAVKAKLLSTDASVSFDEALASPGEANQQAKT